MTPDEFARAAYPLLHEGIVLLRAHAGEGDVINRYVSMVEKVRAQYRAAKEAPEAAPVDKCRGGGGKCGTRVQDLGGPALWGLELEGLWFCSQECRSAHIKETTPIPAPAPEPSAPPAGVPVCPKCGKTMLSHKFYNDGPATVACPPPSDPVTVATGGVPAGYRLGPGWARYNGEVGEEDCTRSDCNDYARFVHSDTGRRSCVAHAVEMGALVPVDTARSVPPGPVPVEACADDDAPDMTPDCGDDGVHQLWCRHAGKPTTPPAAPASEPAARLLSVHDDGCLAWNDKRKYWECICTNRAYDLAAARAEVGQLREKLADAEAQLDTARLVIADRNRDRDAARAEVELLRGKLAEVVYQLAIEEQQHADTAAEATARVRSMREAAAKAIEEHVCSACVHASCASERSKAARIRAIPLDTGTATDTGGDAVTASDVREAIDTVVSASQADTIKAAVDKANNRAADAFHRRQSNNDSPFDDMTTGEFEAWLRSGEDAPGAVTP